MNKTPLILFGTLLATPVMADEIYMMLDADSDGLVQISNTAGSVEVVGWSRDMVEVTGNLGDDVEDLVFERDGNEIIIQVKVPSSSGMWGRKDVTSDLVIKVPENSSLEIATVSADIEVEGVRGEQELQAISGEIDSEVFGADIQIESVSGDIDVTGDGNDAESEIETVSGDISANNLAGDVAAGSVSGSLRVTEGSFERAELETVNGDILYQAELRDGGRLDVETVNGDVRVDFAGDVSARFDIETFNGDIDNCFGPQAERTDRYAPGLELSFNEGSGDGRVNIATMNGDIDICND
jgi:DUF4097 and DUF4098 domain-containing protein YvlB